MKSRELKDLRAKLGIQRSEIVRRTGVANSTLVRLEHTGLGHMVGLYGMLLDALSRLPAAELDSVLGRAVELPPTALPRRKPAASGASHA